MYFDVISIIPTFQNFLNLFIFFCSFQSWQNWQFRETEYVIEGWDSVFDFLLIWVIITAV
jgi:hypothetical protein